MLDNIYDYCILMIAKGDFKMSIMIPAEQCLRCGFIWTKRVDKPAKCPRCKSAKWNIPRSKTELGRKPKWEK